MHTVATRHGPVAFTDEGSGRPLLLLHANPGDHRDFDAVTPALARGHRVLAVDWPGYGRSPSPTPPSSASAMMFAEVALDLVNRLDLRALTIVGNSVGGYAAVRVALERPGRVASLVLVDPGGFTPHNAVSRWFCRRVKGNAWVTRRIATRFAERYLRRRTPAALAILARTEAGRRDRARSEVDAAVWRSFSDPRHDLREAARSLAVPALLVWGRHDPVLPVAKDGACASAALSGSTLIEMDTGHMPFAEDTDAFLTAVLPFLDAGRQSAATPPSTPPGTSPVKMATSP